MLNMDTNPTLNGICEELNESLGDYIFRYEEMDITLTKQFEGGFLQHQLYRHWDGKPMLFANFGFRISYSIIPSDILILKLAYEDNTERKVRLMMNNCDFQRHILPHLQNIKPKIASVIERDCPVFGEHLPTLEYSIRKEKFTLTAFVTTGYVKYEQ